MFFNLKIFDSFYIEALDLKLIIWSALFWIFFMCCLSVKCWSSFKPQYLASFTLFIFCTHILLVFLFHYFFFFCSEKNYFCFTSVLKFCLLLVNRRCFSDQNLSFCSCCSFWLWLQGKIENSIIFLRCLSFQFATFSFCTFLAQFFFFFYKCFFNIFILHL